MPEDELHAWNLTANDLMLLWMAQGSKGGRGIILPSGTKITKDETWQRLLAEAKGMDR